MYLMIKLNLMKKSIFCNFLFHGLFFIVALTVWLPELNAKVSSRNNLLLGKVDQDGNAMVTIAKPKQKTSFRMQVEQATYLPEKCRDQPILDYIVSQLQEGNINCFITCRPSWWNYNARGKEFLEKLPECENDETSNCMQSWRGNILRNTKKYCKAQSFFGEVVKRSLVDSDWCSKVCLVFIYIYL